MATVNCKELGVPNVISKANSDLHGKILTRVGADQVVYPNRDLAQRLAKKLLSKGTMDILSFSDGLSIAEIDVPDSLSGKSLAEVSVRQTFGLTVLCVHRLAADPTQPRSVIMPSPDEIIESEDKLVVFGNQAQIDAIINKAASSRNQ